MAAAVAKIRGVIDIRKEHIEIYKNANFQNSREIFQILENDDLPHKICFRCSAKLEELHEFVQKCIKTQESLQAIIGKNKTKPKIGKAEWEEKLNKSNVSNDDICDALIKKAMEGIKDIPINLKPCSDARLSSGEVSSLKIKDLVDSVVKKEVPSGSKSIQNLESDVTLKKIKLSVEKCDSKSIAVRSLRSKNSKNDDKTSIAGDEKIVDEIKNNYMEEKAKSKPGKLKPDDSNEKSMVVESNKSNLPQKEILNKPAPFNIMDHVTMIKVNGVGVLFQCKLCNRNFLKKEVVENTCLCKNNNIKAEVIKPLPPPEPPKPLNTVKYIDSSKLNNEINRNIKAASETKEVPLLNSKKHDNIISTIQNKSKPRIGPASKINRNQLESQVTPKKSSQAQDGLSSKTTSLANASNSNSALPYVSFPTIPSLNSHYKLVPGPNNTFTLVEEGNDLKNTGIGQLKKDDCKGKPSQGNLNKNTVNISNSENTSVVIDLDDDDKVKPLSSKQQPYPVGLFSTRPHNSNTHDIPTKPDVPTFTTPAMKKQSYTVVQTGNPSKLVISTKQVPVEEIPKKRLKKNNTDVGENVAKEPFSVTLEDVAPPKDAGLFAFINIDPLLQPSYVLPTDNIIQESQISTSTPAVVNNPNIKNVDGSYQCGVCNESFSREKKLLTHMQSHYSKVDDEDYMDDEMINNKKRKRKP